MPVARTYRSDVRAEQARTTRRRILDAAEGLLLAEGFGAMTIARLAERAGVSPQTVYNSVGGKAEVIKGLYDARLAGDDEPVAMSDRPEALAVRDAPTATGCVTAYAAMGRLLYERTGPLLGAVSRQHGDPLLEEFTTTTDTERRFGNRAVVAHLADRFGLAAGLDRDAAVDLCWALTSPELADLLIVRCGWTLDHYEEWLAGALAHGLLGSAPPG